MLGRLLFRLESAMTRTLILLSLALSSALQSQSYSYSPHSVYGNSEGPDSCWYFGGTPGSREQIADGTHRNSAFTVKELAFRHDHIRFSADTGMGRTWSGVQIRMAECDVQTFGSIYSNNALATPTLVFSGGLTWPSMTNLVPPTCPSAFSLRIPFQTSWSYTGVKDILTDYQFSGGVLANNRSWFGPSRIGYYLDSFNRDTFALGQTARLYDPNDGCRDTNSAGSGRAFINLTNGVYGPNFPVVAKRGKVEVDVAGFNFAPSSPVILFLCFGAWVDGLPLRSIFPCNRLYLNVNKTLIRYPLTTNTAGAIAPFSMSGGLASYYAGLAGVNICSQVVWTDTGSGRLKLSDAARSPIHAIPPFASTSLVPMRRAWNYDVGAATALTVTRGDSQIAIVRYAH
jgi:hypothetical protein